MLPIPLGPTVRYLGRAPHAAGVPHKAGTRKGGATTRPWPWAPPWVPRTSGEKGSSRFASKNPGRRPPPENRVERPHHSVAHQYGDLWYEGFYEGSWYDYYEGSGQGQGNSWEYWEGTGSAAWECNSQWDHERSRSGKALARGGGDYLTHGSPSDEEWKTRNGRGGHAGGKGVVAGGARGGDHDEQEFGNAKNSEAKNAIKFVGNNNNNNNNRTSRGFKRSRRGNNEG